MTTPNNEFEGTNMNKEEYEKFIPPYPLYKDLTPDKIRKEVSEAWNKRASDKMGNHTIGE